MAKQGDVRDRASLSAALQAGLDEFGRLDIVVANAGIAPMQSGDDGWRDVIDVNLTGVYNTIKVAIPTMVKQGTGGSIVLISSAAGLAGIGSADAGSIGYAAAKHGRGRVDARIRESACTHKVSGSTRYIRPASTPR